MKQLKFNHVSAGRLRPGPDNITWRIRDDKSLRVGDHVVCVDKVQANKPDTWQVAGIAAIDQISEKRLSDLSDQELEGLLMHSRAELLAASRQFYGEDVMDQTPVKIIRFTFHPHEDPGVTASEAKRRYEQLQLYADGGSRGNPGPSAAGYVLLDMDDRVIHKSGLYLGITTNNQAEYQAVKVGLTAAQQHGAHTVHVYLDSLLVVNQMNGIYKVKNRDLWPIHEALKQLVGQFKEVTFTHVPRELNRLADAAVNETLDALKN
ncbi:hypothetical protein CR970_00060 [Candidatus Saccharibacteria bacterium]|nr:MAG: hypothetical protein CR970_00060 [Candidatus Saccharibacteria bacterium]